MLAAVTRAVVPLLVVACNSTSSDATLDTGIDRVPDDVCVSADPDRQLESECCLAEARREPSAEAKTVIDLSDVAAISNATCAQFKRPEFGHPLPADPQAYPVKIVLPAVPARDAACAELCDAGDAPPTAFGIAIQTDATLLGNNGYGMAIYVPPPWRFVSGGCGEACAWPCLGGYQEFGVRSCTTIYYGDFGFATADEHAPSVEAIVELVEAPAEPGAFGESNCCLFE